MGDDELEIIVIESATDAGDYVATATSLTGTDAYNYTLESATDTTTDWTIKKRSAKIVPLSGQGKEKGRKDGTLMYRVEAVDGEEGSGLVEGETLSGQLHREPGERVGKYYYDFSELIELNPNYSLDCEDNEYFEIWDDDDAWIIHVSSKPAESDKEEDNPETGAPVALSAVPALILSIATAAVFKKK